jgi:hypothetical protein
MSIANEALRSIIRQARRTSPAIYDVAYLRGQINAMSVFFEPDQALVAEAHAEVDALLNKI